jgi:hypothetical protein
MKASKELHNRDASERSSRYTNNREKLALEYRNPPVRAISFIYDEQKNAG